MIDFSLSPTVPLKITQCFYRQMAKKLLNLNRKKLRPKMMVLFLELEWWLKVRVFDAEE